MKKLFRKIVVFGCPFIIIAIGIVIVDPYNYFLVSNLIDKKTKKQISYKINYPLWKCIEFGQNSSPNILLGDSRMNHLNVNLIKKASSIRYYNFAYGAGTLPEMCETFWYAAQETELRNVVFGINFNLYNLANANNRVSGTKAVIKNPLLYLINRNVVKSAFLLIKNYIINKNKASMVSIEKPAMTIDNFWKYQIDVTTKRYYGEYVYPEKFLKQLKEISKHCKEKGINIIFIILPTHTDLQEQVKKYNLEEEDQRFRKELAQCGKVYDFDFANKYTKDRRNFSDPYHFNSDFGKKVIRTVWCGENPEMARVY